MCLQIVFVVKLVTILSLITHNGVSQELNETMSEFAKIVGTPSFIDKTMFIKDFFDDKTQILLTAPHMSGKTTVLDMLRTFLELQVDRTGIPRRTGTTLNYKIFKKNNLNITKDEEFFDEHFGKYPLIVVDLKPLKMVSNFNEMLEMFKDTLRRIYQHHDFLLKRKDLWLDEVEVEHFNNFIMESRGNKITATYMLKALPYLCEILFMHSGMRVIVLIDDYDALVDSLDYSTNPDIDRITRFLQRFNRGLLQSKYVDRALLTGVYRVTSAPLPIFTYTVLPINTTTYSYLDDRPICKHFRLQFG